MFLEQWASSLEIFDPLDRHIGEEDEPNQAISQQELRQKVLEEMQGIEGRLLSAPMSQQAQLNLEQMFEKAEMEINELGGKFIEIAGEMGTEFRDSFSRQRPVKQYLRNLAFLKDHQLIGREGEIELKIKQFKEKISDFENLIQNAKKSYKSSKFSKLVLGLLKDIMTASSERDYSKLVEKMVQTQDLITKSKKEADPRAENIEQMAERNMIESMASRNIENIVTRLSYDTFELSKFAYQLRKMDQQNQYTNEFLYGNVQP